MSEERSKIQVIEEGKAGKIKGRGNKALSEVVSRPFDYPMEDWKRLDDEEKEWIYHEHRRARKEQLASVLERGVVATALHVETLPSNLHGEWVRDDQVEIYRMETLGYKIDTEYAKDRRTHSKGDSASYVGDVVFMTTPRENYELINEVKQEMFDRIHGTKKGQSEEQQFEKSIKSKTPELPVIDEGKASKVKKAEIEAALQGS